MKCIPRELLSAPESATFQLFVCLSVCLNKQMCNRTTRLFLATFKGCRAAYIPCTNQCSSLVLFACRRMDVGWARGLNLKDHTNLCKRAVQAPYAVAMLSDSLPFTNEYPQMEALLGAVGGIISFHKHV